MTAVPAERDAAASRWPKADRVDGPIWLLRATTGAGCVDLIAGGVGVAAAAAMTAAILARALAAGRPYGLVLNAGVAGGFQPVRIGDTVVADAVVHADLGAEDGTHFRPASQLGLGRERTDLDPTLVAELSRRTGARAGAVLSVSTVTGSEETRRRRLAAHPDAVAEAMEGAGALAAARLLGVNFAEIRTISNMVGPRDRGAWRLDAALDALAHAIDACLREPLPTRAPAAL